MLRGVYGAGPRGGGGGEGFGSLAVGLPGMYDVVRREKIKQRSERNLGKTGVIILCTAVVNWSKTVDLERRFLLLLSLYCTTITGDHCYKDQILLVKLAIYTWYRFLIAP